MNWNGTNVLITGASRGLGEALARELATRGASLALVARSAAVLQALTAQLCETGTKAFAITADLAVKDDIHRISGEAAALLGSIDVVIHNAGTLGPVPLRPVLDTDCEDLEAALATNVVGPFRLTRALAGAMVVRGAGTLVFVSSDAATEAYAGWGAYGASKAAVDQLARVLAVEEPKLRVVRFDPGEMDTRMHADAVPDADRTRLTSPMVAARRLLEVLDAG